MIKKRFFLFYFHVVVVVVALVVEYTRSTLAYHLTVSILFSQPFNKLKRGKFSSRIPHHTIHGRFSSFCVRASFLKTRSLEFRRKYNYEVETSFGQYQNERNRLGLNGQGGGYVGKGKGRKERSCVVFFQHLQHCSKLAVNVAYPKNLSFHRS